MLADGTGLWQHEHRFRVNVYDKRKNARMILIHCFLTYPYKAQSNLSNEHAIEQHIRPRNLMLAHLGLTCLRLASLVPIPYVIKVE